MDYFTKNNLERLIRQILPEKMNLSADVPEILGEILGFYAEEITEKAIKICRLEGKKTLKKEHFTVANKLYLSEAQSSPEEEESDLPDEVLLKEEEGE